MRRSSTRPSPGSGWLIAVLALTSLPACGPFGAPTDTLGVPYRSQDFHNSCVAASVLMWRLYDGLPEIPQQDIINAIGAPCNIADAAQGVSQFTNSLGSADVVLSPSSAGVESIVARQATAYSNGFPSLAELPLRQHAGVVNGGQYHQDAGTNLYVWDYVKFHDPDPIFGPNDYYIAADWLDAFCRTSHSYCAQVIDSSSVVGWAANKSTYGPPNGYALGDPPPGGEWPPAY